MKRSLLALLFGAVALVGCGGGYGYGYYSNYPPPPARVEAYGVAPGPGFVWISGYHAWRGNGYAWVPGYWGRPPRPHARYVPGYWERHGNRYRYRDGRWR